MPAETWLPLTTRERVVLLEALAAYSGGEAASTTEVAGLSQKIAQLTPFPDITVGVYGGQVQWIVGNPFPIRVCDYDGDEKDLPHLDENGERCRMWFEQGNNLRNNAD